MHPQILHQKDTNQKGNSRCCEWAVNKRNDNSLITHKIHEKTVSGIRIPLFQNSVILRLILNVYRYNHSFCTCHHTSAFNQLRSLHSRHIFPAGNISWLQSLPFHKPQEFNFYSCADFISSVRYFTNILANKFYAVKFRNSQLIGFSLNFLAQFPQVSLSNLFYAVNSSIITIHNHLPLTPNLFHHLSASKNIVINMSIPVDPC